MRAEKLRIGSMAAGLALAVALAPLAFGHAYIDRKEANAGWSVDVDIRVPHGCKGSPTTSVRVKIPEGITAVHPLFSQRWKIATTKRKLPKPFKTPEGVVVSEVIDEITWSGNVLPDDLYDSFAFRVKMPDEPGRIMYFKTIQTCQNGVHRWVEVPDRPMKWIDFLKEHKEPAPFVRLVKAPGPQLDLAMTIQP